MELTDRAEYDESKLKEIAGVVPGSVSAGSQLIWLAWWMKERYGSTMNQALKTVLPVKQKVKEAPRRQIRCLLAGEELDRALAEADMLMIGGTSLNVYPAAGLIRYYQGHRLVLLNKSPVARDLAADLVITDPIGETLAQL